MKNMYALISSAGFRKVVPIVALAILGLAFLTSQPDVQQNETGRLQETKKANIPKKARLEYIEDRDRFEFDQLKDPRTGRIPLGIRRQELALADRLPKREEVTDNPENLNTYTSLGPTNFGGRTRAFAFDKRNASIRLSGGVSTGIFRTVNDGATWLNVTPPDGIHNVTALAQDPRSGSEDTWYYGTGEYIGNSASGFGASYLGNGIFKSTDNGLTWNPLAATMPGTLESFDNYFDVTFRIVVDPTNGYVYAAVYRSIFRSTDGGTTWNMVLGDGVGYPGTTDIVVSVGGRFYAAFDGKAGNNSTVGLPPSAAMDGVWTSTTGAAGSWTKIAGSGSGTTPAGWNAADAYSRIVLAMAPSNPDILYILYDNLITSGQFPQAEFFKWTQSTTSGINRSANLPIDPVFPFAVQGGYDLAVSVKPDDENFVLIGGTELYRSTDGFATTGATTHIGGYGVAGHHPDIHTLVFHPTTPSIMVSGDDGGIHEADVTATPVVWTSLNSNYVTFQYYYVTLSPDGGSTNFIGGTQDNGTTYSTGSSTHIEVSGGDGTSVGISAGNIWHYVGFQQGYILRRNPADPPHVWTHIKPNGSGSGLFITLFHLDFLNTEHLYYASNTALYRTTSASTVTQGTWTLMTGISSTVVGNISTITTSYDTSGPSHKLYVGTALGRVYRLNDPANAAAGTAPTNITGAAFPSGAYVSGIAVDPSDNRKIMVTFSNYGVTSIWYTADASVAAPVWTAIEGTLTLPSVRSCKIVERLGFPTEYYVGTSVGLYSTTALSGATTSWVMEGSETIRKSVVRTLAYRPIDNLLLIGTHGDGMFQTSVPNPVPIQLASFTGQVLANGSVHLRWTTLSELNNYGFYVERRRTGESAFIELPNSFIPGHGTTTEPKHYSFTDITATASSWQYRLRQVDLDGTQHFSEPITILVVTGIDGGMLPISYQLYQNHPNPFNPSTTIKYALSKNTLVRLTLFNTLGQLVRVLVDEAQQPGYHEVKLDAGSLASGVYLYRIEAGEFVQTRKLILLR